MGILLSTLLLAAASETEDHLEPATSDSENAAAQLFAHTHREFQMVTVSSLGGRSEAVYVTTDRDGQMKAVVAQLVPAAGKATKGPDGGASTADVWRAEVALAPELAARLKRVWSMALVRAGPLAGRPRLKAGTQYGFAVFEPTADRFGVTVAPVDGSRTAALVQLATLLGKYVRAAERERPWLQRQLENGTHALALRFIGEKESDGPSR